MSGDNKKRGPGRPPGSKNKTALVRADKAASAVVAEVCALKAEGRLYTLGKDRLAEIDGIMMRLALAYSPAEKDEKGNPCRPYWENPADEMRFLRFMGLSYDCAKARAPYESPRLSATTGDQAGGEDHDDGSDPRENLLRIVENWIAADAAERAERALDVTPPAEPEPVAVEAKPDPDDDGIDGELA